jgi:type I restriction enzyme S subunit
MPSHCILNDGDILLSLTGNVGRVCLVNGEDYLLNQRVAKLVSKYPTYAYCLFRNKDMFDIMNNLANGAAQQNLSPIRTENVRILIPSDGLIQKFEDVVSPMISKMLVLNKANSNLKQARDRLLPRLMSGELEV